MLYRLKHIDGITMIDKTGTILYTIKFNPQFYEDINNQQQVIGKNLFSAFPTLDETSSTLYNVMKTGKPIYRARQKIVDFRGVEKITSNISYPVKANGKIIGSIELSEDISARERSHNMIRAINTEIFHLEKQRINHSNKQNIRLKILFQMIKE